MPIMFNRESQSGNNLSTSARSSKDDGLRDSDISKIIPQSLPDQENALDFILKNGQNITYTPQEEHKIKRKIDLVMLPLLGITDGVQLIDKVTLSYAVVYGLRQDVHLAGNQYNWLSSAFYIAMITFTYPQALLMQKYNAAKIISILMFIWGGIVIVHGACTNFAGLLACRILLGAFEANIRPSLNIITSNFYKRQEIPARTGIWVSFDGLSYMIGNLLAYGCGNIKSGSLPAWKYIFIVIGSVTSFWAIILWIFLDSNPVTARFLTERERSIAVLRLGENKSGANADKKIKKDQIIEAFMDPQVILIWLIAISSTMPTSGIYYFLPIIIQGLGYDGIQTVVHMIPYGAVLFLSMIIAGFVLTYLKNCRIYLAIIAMTSTLVCSAMIWKLDSNNRVGLLFATYFIATFSASTLVFFTLAINNIAGTSKKWIVNAGHAIAFSLGSIIGPFFFGEDEAPRYASGCKMMVISSSISVGLYIILRLYYMYENRRKLNALNRKNLNPSEHEQEAERLGFLDYTDKQNPYFFATL